MRKINSSLHKLYHLISIILILSRVYSGPPVLLISQVINAPGLIFAERIFDENHIMCASNHPSDDSLSASVLLSVDWVNLTLTEHLNRAKIGRSQKLGSTGGSTFFYYSNFMSVIFYEYYAQNPYRNYNDLFL